MGQAVVFGVTTGGAKPGWAFEGRCKPVTWLPLKLMKHSNAGEDLFLENGHFEIGEIVEGNMSCKFKKGIVVDDNGDSNEVLDLDNLGLNATLWVYSSSIMLKTDAEVKPLLSSPLFGASLSLFSSCQCCY